MNGIINVLKPPGMTSFDVIAYLRGVLGIRKLGHTGTLDPGAAGVLPVCAGSATRAIEYITNKDKYYRAELTLGFSTSTQDSFGAVISKRNADIKRNKVEEVMKRFIGDYRQTPPMYSAVKINGKKLYEFARKGIEVKREPREVTIHTVDILNVKKQLTKGNPEILTTKVLFDVKCSKGTYIRTLCSDIGEQLGCGGHMSFLIRMGTGIFNISSSVTLEHINRVSGKGEIGKILTRTDKVFSEYKAIILGQDEEKRFLNGVSIECDENAYSIGELLRVYNKKGEFIALGEIVNKNNKKTLKSQKRFQ